MQDENHNHSALATVASSGSLHRVPRAITLDLLIRQFRFHQSTGVPRPEGLPPDRGLRALRNGPVSAVLSHGSGEHTPKEFPLRNLRRKEQADSHAETKADQRRRIWVPTPAVMKSTVAVLATSPKSAPRAALAEVAITEVRWLPVD